VKDSEREVIGGTINVSSLRKSGLDLLDVRPSQFEPPETLVIKACPRSDWQVERPFAVA
jgi:hypothetical protein